MGTIDVTRSIFPKVINTQYGTRAAKVDETRNSAQICTERCTGLNLPHGFIPLHFPKYPPITRYLPLNLCLHLQWKRSILSCARSLIASLFAVLLSFPSILLFPYKSKFIFKICQETSRPIFFISLLFDTIIQFVKTTTNLRCCLYKLSCRFFNQ